MDRAKFEIAVNLRRDIKAIQTIVSEGRKRHWVKVICPVELNWIPSERFQRELISWLESKIIEYENEFESL